MILEIVHIDKVGLRLKDDSKTTKKNEACYLLTTYIALLLANKKSDLKVSQLFLNNKR